MPVVWSSRCGSRQIEHMGSAHGTRELGTLKAAQQRIAAEQLKLALRLEPAGGCDHSSRTSHRLTTETGRPGTAPWSRTSPGCSTFPPAGRDAGHRSQGASHPRAQLRFTDLDGHRFTAIATDARKCQLADL